MTEVRIVVMTVVMMALPDRAEAQWLKATRGVMFATDLLEEAHKKAVKEEKSLRNKAQKVRILPFQCPLQVCSLLERHVGVEPTPERQESAE